MQRRASKLVIASIFLGAGLAACERYQSGPAPTTGAPGPSGRPLERSTAEQPHSAPVSQGTPTLGGGTTSGRPTVERSGQGSGDLGGTPELERRGSRSRSN